MAAIESSDPVLAPVATTGAAPTAGHRLRVLVVGAGITGCTSAIALARRGLEVRLVEIVADQQAVGHGITIQGNALRAWQELGVSEALLTESFPFDCVRLRHADGSLIAEVPAARTGGSELPATVGAMRTTLMRVLGDHVTAAGVRVDRGLSPTWVEDGDDGARVGFSDGSTETYDIVVGADGIRSAMRAMIGVPERPRPSGMSIWRCAAPRPPEMTAAEVYYGGPRFKAGYSPVSADSCYAYILDEPVTMSDFPGLAPYEVLRRRSEGYAGTWGRVRETIGIESRVHHTQIEWLLVPTPWHRGRVVLIGDAVHACPPLIAQGAAMCAEDAVVLADMLAAYLSGDAGDLDAVLTAFASRRMPRVQLVLDSSLQLVSWEIDPTQPGADPGALMKSTMAALVGDP